MQESQLTELLRVYRDYVEERSHFPEIEEILKIVDSLIDRAALAEARFFLDYLIVRESAEGCKMLRGIQEWFEIRTNQDILPHSVANVMRPRKQPDIPSVGLKMVQSPIQPAGRRR